MCQIRLSHNKALSVYSEALCFIFLHFFYLDRGALKIARLTIDCRFDAYSLAAWYGLFRESLLPQLEKLYHTKTIYIDIETNDQPV